MYVVAITRWGAALDQELAALAPLLGISLYDARLRLAGPVPTICSQLSDADQARALMQTLRERGHGAVACDLAQVPRSASMLAPRELELAPSALVLGAPLPQKQALPYADILAIIHARLAIEHASVTDTTTKQFSMGRALATSGLSRNKTVTTQSHATRAEYEQVLYLVRRDGTEPVLLQRDRIRYACLGERMGRTAMESFPILVETLRERAPDALYHRGLVEQKRKAQSTSLGKSREGNSKNRSEQTSVTHSNVGATDLAAHLIAVGHLRSQL